MADPELIEAARRGDEAALSRLIAACSPDLRRYARRSCATEDVDDSVQDALIILSRRLGSLRQVANLSAWLFRVVKRACQRRWRGRAGNAAGGGDALDRARDPADPDLRLDLGRAIAALPQALREVVVLRDIDGLTAEETASRLGASVDAVKSRLHRARLAVRRQMM